MDPAYHLRTQAVALREVPEELANSLTHGVGLGLSLVAGIDLLAIAQSRGPSWLTVGCGIYIASLVAVYAASTLSHVYHQSAWQETLRVADQAAIYLLIAGNFTPFALAFLNDGVWQWLIVAMWGLALAGMASKVLFRHRVHGVATWAYIALGWLPVLGMLKIVPVLPSGGTVLIVAGGVAYTLGTLFLTFDRRVRYFHAVWHLLVIAGSALHFAAVMFYVVPFVQVLGQ